MAFLCSSSGQDADHCYGGACLDEAEEQHMRDLDELANGLLPVDILGLLI